MAVSGKLASVQIGAAYYAMSGFDLAIGGDLPDVTNFLSGGCDENVDGVSGIEITLRGPYAPGSMPLAKGSVYSFSLGFTTVIGYVVAARVKDIKFSVDVKGAPQITVTAKSTGPFTPVIV